MTSDEPNASELVLTSQDYADCRLVSVSGRVDHTNFQRFQDDLSDLARTVPAQGGMVVDLGKLEFITSAGLRALLLTEKTVSESGAKLVITGIGGVVKEVFRISKFDALLSVADSADEAVANVSASAASAFKS